MSNPEIQEKIQSREHHTLQFQILNAQPSIAFCELLIQQQNRLENGCSTELAQICEEMERKCQGGTLCPLGRIERQVAVAG